MIILRLEVNNIFKMYKKLFSLLLCLILVVVGTFIIKYYFKPFLTMIIMIIICTPVYSIMIKAKIPNRIAGALSIISINTLMILIAIYLGNEIFNICKKVYFNECRVDK